MTNRQTAIKVIKQLHSQGHRALLAGGCVRDMLLKRPAKDFDVATDATPREVIRMFKRTIKIAAHFGVVMVLLDNQQIEVATFRSDTGYEDGRHPTAVEFVSPQEDASRRDFTINGMFYDPLNEQVIDYVKGRDDLKKQIIRTIGSPDERFQEDYLRMLRAVRFATQLDFRIEPKTWSAICHNALNITRISGERIAMELESILVNPNRCLGSVMLIKTGLAEAIFPEFAGERAKFAMKALAELRKKVGFPLALATFFADCQTKFALEKCVVLMLSKNQNKHVKFLLNNRQKLLNEQMSLADLKKIASNPYFRDLYELQTAIQEAAKEPLTPLTNLRKRLRDLGDVELKPKPLLNGHDLMRLGAVRGPMLGHLAEEMYAAQLEGNIQTPEQAEDWALKWLQKHNQK